MKKTLLAVLVTAAAFCSAAGAAELTGTLKKVADTGEITLGYRESSVPFSYLNNDALYPVNWVFQTFPSQDFKDQLGQHLSQYASGKEDWTAVKDYFVSGWAEGKSKA